jgi:hypothetical protein
MRYVSIVILSALLLACASAKVPATDSCVSGAPDWALNSPSDWNTTAGFAELEKGGARLSRTLAINNAKEQLTLKIAEKLELALKKLNGKNNTAGNKKIAADISNNLTLANAKQKYIWQSPCNTVHVYVTITPQDAVSDIEQAIAQDILPSEITVSSLI